MVCVPAPDRKRNALPMPMPYTAARSESIGVSILSVEFHYCRSDFLEASKESAESAKLLGSLHLAYSNHEKCCVGELQEIEEQELSPKVLGR